MSQYSILILYQALHVNKYDLALADYNGVQNDSTYHIF